VAGAGKISDELLGHAGVVEQNHFAVLGKSVGQRGIPVIHRPSEVHEEEQWDVDRYAEAAGGEANAGRLNELGWRGLVTATAHETSVDGICGKREPQRASFPPSAASEAPVMKEALSEARKRIASATSSGWPIRFMGTREIKSALFSGVPVKRFNIPVSIGPGATTLIRTPVSANSRAAAL